MNDNTPANEVSINIQYIKDFSLEIPHAPQIFSKLATQPQINVDLNIDVNKLDSDNFEVTLNLRINANLEKEPFFILELSYAAACTVKIPEEQKEPLLYIEIPKLLFPFARQIIASNIANAGHPPLMLTPVDFAAVYQEKKQKEAANKAN